MRCIPNEMISICSFSNGFSASGRDICWKHHHRLDDWVGEVLAGKELSLLAPKSSGLQIVNQELGKNTMLAMWKNPIWFYQSSFCSRSSITVVWYKTCLTFERGFKVWFNKETKKRNRKKSTLQSASCAKSISITRCCHQQASLWGWGTLRWTELSFYTEVVLFTHYWSGFILLYTQADKKHPEKKKWKAESWKRKKTTNQVIFKFQCQ